MDLHHLAEHHVDRADGALAGKALRTEIAAFEMTGALGDARARCDDASRLGNAGNGKFIDSMREIGGTGVHGLAQLVGGHVPDKEAGFLGIDDGVFAPAIDMLMAYHWPGNVRELENAIERAVVVCDGQVVHAHHLPPTLQTAASSGTVMSLSLKDALDAYEKDLIQDALKTSRGNRAKAARLLNTTGRIMNYKVRQLGIDWRRFKK